MTDEDRNADKRNAIMKAEQAYADAYNDIKLTPEWAAYLQADIAMQATPAYALMQERAKALNKLHDEHGEPEHQCEGCGVPFFEGDRYGVDEYGCASCLEDGPCYAPPEKPHA